MDLNQAQQTPLAAEIHEQLGVMDDGLFRLEAAGDDREALDAMFHAIHAIKRSAGLHDVDSIVTLACAAENVLDRACRGEVTVDSRLIASMRLCHERIGQLAGGGDDGDSHPHLQDTDRTLVNHLCACLGAGRGEQEQIYGRALPIWFRQIGTAKTQMEEAIMTLTARFSGLVEKLEAAVIASQEAAGGMGGAEGGSGLVQLIGESERELTGIIDSLKSALQVKNAMLKEIAGLAAVADELKQMVAAVAIIARQTKLLSINAAIEAAHAGEVGKGFSVVADEVRDLATHAGDTVKDMNMRVETISAAIAAVLNMSAQYAKREEEMVVDSEAAIRGVLNRFNGATDGLSRSAVLLQRESVGIRDEISDVLVSLQFQDRVSQVLTHVQTYMRQLRVNMKRSLSGEDSAAFDGEAWLAEMETSYTTDEQRANHRGKAKATATASKGDITFF